MRYSRVFLEAIDYELPQRVVSTSELERHLQPLYQTLRIPLGQLEALTGISQRRWWEPNFRVADGAVAAARKALESTHIRADDIEMLVYTGVCRQQLEPATACEVASKLGVSPDATVYDISNACLGVLNGIIQVANAIELGQCRAGLVVSCETAREINEAMIDQMIHSQSMELFKQGIATLTGGSGAVAVLVVDEELSFQHRRRLVGGVARNAPQHHKLCRWGWENISPTIERIASSQPATYLKNKLVGMADRARHLMAPFMSTDAVNVLKYGVELGQKTWQNFLYRVGWATEQLDKVICHQVGSSHRETILKTLGIPVHKEYSTFQTLGNIGTVSLPLTAAIAEENGFLQQGDRVGFLGIGSGLNCMMLGVEW